MPPISLLRAKDDAKKYGLEPEVVLKLKEKAMLARGVAYCMFCYLINCIDGSYLW